LLDDVDAVLGVKINENLLPRGRFEPFREIRRERTDDIATALYEGERRDSTNSGGTCRAALLIIED